MIRLLRIVFTLLTGRNVIKPYAYSKLYAADVIAEAELIKVQAADGVA